MDEPEKAGTSLVQIKMDNGPESSGTKRATTSFTLVGTSADFTLSVLIRRV